MLDRDVFDIGFRDSAKNREPPFVPKDAEALNDLYTRAWSYENRVKWGKEKVKTEYCGSIQKFERIYDLYSDEQGGAWYKVRIITPGGVMEESDVCFGSKKKAGGWRKLT